MLALGVAFAFVLSISINRPWVGDHDMNGVVWSAAVRNILRAGWNQTKGGLSLYQGPLPIPTDSYYVHHPPMIAWLITLAYAAVGEQEWAARLIPILFSLAGFAALAILLIERYGPNAAWWGCLIYVLMPAQLYYGKMPNHEPLALSVMLMSILFLLRWRATGRLAWGLAFVGILFFGCLSAWSVYLFALGLIAGLIIGGWYSDTRYIILIGLTCALGLAFLYWFIQTVRPDGLKDLFRAFENRASMGTVWRRWPIEIFGHLVKLFSTIALAISVMNVAVRSGEPATDRQLDTRYLVILPLTVAGIGNIVLFSQGSFVHEYYCYYLSGLLAVLAARFYSMIEHLDSPSPSAFRWLSMTLVVAMGIHSFRVYWDLSEKQSFFFSAGQRESYHFLAKLGEAIDRQIPHGVVVYSSAMDHGPHLAYYAKREIKYVRFRAKDGGIERKLGPENGAVLYLSYPSDLDFWNYLKENPSQRAGLFEPREIEIEEHPFVFLVPIGNKLVPNR